MQRSSFADDPLGRSAHTRGRDSRGVVFGAAFSLAVHGIGVALLSGAGPAPDPPDEMTLVAFHAVGDAGGAAMTRSGSRGHPAPPKPGGAQSVQNIDSRSLGGGGTRRGARDVILLLSRADSVTLQDSPMNAWTVSQTHRIRTERDRATVEQRRATPNPNDQPFLASGDGFHPERRPVATTDAADGARIAPAASSLGGEPASPNSDNSPRRPATRAPAVPNSASGNLGGSAPSPGPGILRGTGARPTGAARVAYGRPPIDQGPAATQSEEVEGPIRDSHDAELLASRLVQSWTEATQRRGRIRGPGQGGAEGLGAPGSGLRGPAGGAAQPYGPGRGPFPSLDTADGRYQSWYGQVRRRVYSRLSFPRARALAMDQGWSVHRIRVDPQGRLVGTPQLQRSSGFGDFDHAARAAIVTAAPFPPLPLGLLSGRRGDHTLSMRIEHANPMVQ